MQEFDDTLSVLHRQFVDGDRAAFDRLTEALLPLLATRLTLRFRQLGPEVGDAVEDALLDYRSQPWRFDPSRASLATFLYRIAWRNATDRCRSDARRRQREEHWARARTDHICVPRISENIPALAKRLHVPAGEMAAFELWVAGERQPALLAAALGVSDLPARSNVARSKDSTTACDGAVSDWLCDAVRRKENLTADVAR